MPPSLSAARSPGLSRLDFPDLPSAAGVSCGRNPIHEFPVGTYRLAAVDGRCLPRVWDEGACEEGMPSRVWFLSGSAEFSPGGLFRYEVQGRIETSAGHVMAVQSCARGAWGALGPRRVSLAYPDGRVRVWVAASGGRGLLQRSSYRRRSGERVLALLLWSPS